MSYGKKVEKQPWIKADNKDPRTETLHHDIHPPKY